MRSAWQRVVNVVLARTNSIVRSKSTKSSRFFDQFGTEMIFPFAG
jgi:hypothetical protein